MPQQLIGKKVMTDDGHKGIVIKHFYATARGMMVHIKQNDGRVWFCPENSIVYIEED